MLGATLVLGAALAAAQLGLGGHLLINFTPSIPRGIYWIETHHRPPQPGDLVAFPVPDNVRDLVYQRQYVPRHIRLLSKPVAAAGGDHVCVRGTVLEVNGKPSGSIFEFDRKGDSMPRYMGCGVLRADELFVATGHDQSFDSRYFGPINVSAIRGTLVPLLTL